MKDTITHKGYLGSVHFNSGDKVFHGKIEGIDDLVTFEGKSVNELMRAFHDAVDDYIQFCEEVGKEPEKSYKGSFNVRISANLHRRAAEKAALMGMSLNQLVQKAIEDTIVEKPLKKAGACRD